MTLYLDASVLVALFIQEALTDDAHAAIEGHVLIVSDFAVAEFSAGVGRRVRTRDISQSDAESVFTTFDVWTAKVAQREVLATGDLTSALCLVRRLDLGLRTPDAINIAIAQRCQASLFTFDGKMAIAARVVGVDVL